MNARQKERYQRHFGEGRTPIHRVASCGHCDFTARVARHGVRGGALASAAKLRGMMMEHLRTKHPEVLGD